MKQQGCKAVFGFCPCCFNSSIRGTYLVRDLPCKPICIGQYPLQMHDKCALVWQLFLHQVHKSTPHESICILPKPPVICVQACVLKYVNVTPFFN